MVVATSIGVLGAFLAAPLAEATMIAPGEHRAALHLQDDAEAQPSQVGEGDADTEALDQGPPPAAPDDDVETLDQGSPPTETGPVPVPVADGTVLTAAPVASDTAYAAPAGPQLPPGFGEGRVLVSNNSRGFPVGLEPCEVGVVTGRAYVGVKCGDAGGPVVGHSTYEDFPWVIDPGFPFDPGAAVVTDPSFPFDEDSPFYEGFLDRTTDSDVVVLVSPRGFPFNDDDEGDASANDAPSVTTRGVVSIAQPARAGKERNRERSSTSGSASSGEVVSDPGKSRTRRSTSKKQKAKVRSESKRGKNSQGNNKAKSGKKKDRKGAKKESKKQRAKGEKQEKRNKDK